MNISPLGRSPFQLNLRVGSSSGNASSASRLQLNQQQSARNDATFSLLRRVGDLRETFRNFEKILEQSRNSRGTKTQTTDEVVELTSDSALEIPISGQSSTTLESTEEVNSVAASYSTTGDFENRSTASVEFTGSYSGQDDDTLSFNVLSGGTVGDDDIQIEVLDGAGAEIETFLIEKDSILGGGLIGDGAAGTPIELSNGLSFTPDEGTFQTGETLSLQVYGDGSFDPPSSDTFEASSTAGFSLTGEYAGIITDALTFEVTTGGTLGEDDVTITVTDSEGAEIDQLQFNQGEALDGPVTLSNGLELDLTAGSLTQGDRFTVDVTAEGTVNPDNPFNGTGESGANFESGLAVTAGSFEINGVIIEVEETDSINDVLDKINASDAGVTAEFDAETEKITLTANDSGSGGQVVLANDTSGFLAATKLADAIATQGSDGVEGKLTEIAELSGLQSGTFSVNGTEISVDVDNDTLDDLIARINDADAGVTAALTEDGKLEVKSDEAGTDVELDDGDSLLFSTLGIETGLHEGTRVEVIETEASPEATSELLDGFGNLGAGLDEAFLEALELASDSSGVRSATESVQGIVSDAFENILDKNGSRDQLRTGFGFDFNFKEGADTFLEVDSSSFETALASNSDLIRDFFLADRNGEEADGLLPQLDQAFAELEEDLRRELGPGPGLIDFFA